jgi:hypothetical protein
VVSQIGAFCGHIMLEVQAARQVWVLGSQVGVVPPPQSALLMHCTQLPFKHWLWAVGQSVLLRQSTQPRAPSQNWPMRQLLVPLGPHSALPSPGPWLPASVPDMVLPSMPGTTLPSAPGPPSGIFKPVLALVPQDDSGAAPSASRVRAPNSPKIRIRSM